MLNHTRSQQLFQEGFRDRRLPWRQLNMSVSLPPSLFCYCCSTLQNENDSGQLWVSLQMALTAHVSILWCVVNSVMFINRRVHKAPMYHLCLYIMHLWLCAGMYTANKSIKAKMMMIHSPATISEVREGGEGKKWFVFVYNSVMSLCKW